MATGERRTILRPRKLPVVARREAAKQPDRARNEPALTTAAVRRADRAGCGRRRRGRGAGVRGVVVASMGPTLRSEPVSRHRAAGEVALRPARRSPGRLERAACPRLASTAPIECAPARSLK